MTLLSCLTPVFLPGADFAVPCGKCKNCIIAKNKEWVCRIMQEYKQTGIGCCATLTYAQTDGNLHRRDIQLFIKRLRKYIEPQKVRYFYAGEYGGKNNRPHYHIMLFGWRPDDLREHCRTKRGNISYKSDLLTRLWKHGFVDVGDINPYTARYCARYLQKLDRRPHDVPSFIGMSMKPGIGAGAVSPEYLATDGIYIDGKRYSIPRYYVRYLEKQGYNIEMVTLRRKAIAKAIDPTKKDGVFDVAAIQKLHEQNEISNRELNRIDISK